MAPFTPLLLALLASSRLALGHFQVLTPAPLGGDAEQEDDSPCGGYTPDLSDGSSQMRDFHVGGEPISLQSSHPQSNWLFRATLDASVRSGWVEIHPIFQQSGIGTFCMPEVSVPSNWTGEKGVVGIVGNGGDGMLFACVAANFIEGTARDDNQCSNSSGIEISAISDGALTGQLGTPADNDDGGDDGHDHDDGDHDHGDAATGVFAPLAGLVSLAALLGATLALF